MLLGNIKIRGVKKMKEPTEEEIFGIRSVAIIGYLFFKMWQEDPEFRKQIEEVKEK